MKRFLNLSWAIVFLLHSASSWAIDAVTNPTGLQQAVAVDIVGKSRQGADGPTDRLLPREAELILFAPTDYIFDGMLNLAAIHETSKRGSETLATAHAFQVQSTFILGAHPAHEF